MKRVIRSIRTKEFFSGGTWTLDPALAQDFPDTRELLMTCAQYDLRDVELAVLLGYEPPGTCDLRVPLPRVDWSQFAGQVGTGTPGSAGVPVSIPR